MTEVTVFRLKLHFSRRKSVAKFIYVKTVSSKVVSYSLANLTVKKMVGIRRRLLPEISAETDPSP